MLTVTIIFGKDFLIIILFIYYKILNLIIKDFIIILTGSICPNDIALVESICPKT